MVDPSEADTTVTLGSRCYDGDGVPEWPTVVWDGRQTDLTK